LTLSSPVLADAKKVAIASFGDHWALQQIIDGMKARMADLGFRDGTDVVYSYAHVNWERNLIQQMLTKAVAGKPDVLFTLTTPVAQTAARAVRDSGVPIVFSAIQDPVIAGLTPSWDKASAGMTGATNPADAEGTLRFIKLILPTLKRLGFPYNPGDDADTAVRQRFAAVAPSFDVKLEFVGIDNINNVGERIQSLSGKVDAIYVLPSSLLQSATPAIAASADRIAVPAFNGLPEPILKHEMLATYSVDWFRVGGNAATIIAQILRGRAAADIPPVNPTAADHTVLISQSQVRKLGLVLPLTLKDCGKCLVP
jgi:putative ABC transport system substrate-binding protein